MFIAQKIGFMDISKHIITAFHYFTKMPENLEEVFTLDNEVRAYVSALK